VLTRMFSSGVAVMAAVLMVACTSGRTVQPATPAYPELVTQAADDSSELYIRGTLLQLGTLHSGIVRYYRAYGVPPDSLEQAFPRATPRERELIFTDTRQRPLRYRRSGDVYVLRASGVDGMHGTQDDLVWIGFRDRIDACGIIRGDGVLRHFERSAPACPTLPVDDQPGSVDPQL
jgi:hypothetical protein